MNKLDLLRTVVPSLYSEPTAFGGPGSSVGVRPEGRRALRDLAHAIFETPHYLRGTTFDRLLAEMLGVVSEGFVGMDATAVGQAQLDQLEGSVADWFSKEAGSHCLYIPCAISRWPAASFAIGPVAFSHLDTFSKTEGAIRDELGQPFDRMMEWMHESAAHWMATIEVKECMKERAEELGGIAVDLALTAVQLVVRRGFGAESMARLGARAAPRQVRSVMRSNGSLSVGWTRSEPGMSIDQGTLARFLSAHPTFLIAAGSRIFEFLNDDARLPKLSRAWADSAYWFHEGLAEQRDTIAVAKLETALEVLMCAENIRRGKARMLAAIAAFHGQKATDRLLPELEVTVQEFVDRFVEDRSRILHGTRSTLGSHLRDSRPLLSHLANSLLRHYAVELDQYVGAGGDEDSVDSFVASVRARRERQTGA